MSFQNRAENLSTNAGAAGDYLKNNGAGSLCSWETPPFQQCAFSAYLGTLATDVTGDGTIWALQNLTEDFDLGNDFDATTGQFTVPTTGKYYLSAGIIVQDLDSNMTDAEIRIRRAGGALAYLSLNNPYACRQVSLGTYSSNVATILQLTAGDVIEIYVTISGSTKTADVRNGRASSYFNGYFLGA